MKRQLLKREPAITRKKKIAEGKIDTYYVKQRKQYDKIGPSNETPAARKEVLHEDKMKKRKDKRTKLGNP